jgi:NTP pyrophosphatase (non-canonical NTP hydrolase)
MKEEFVSVYKNYIDKYGVDSQIRMCIEEMSELTKALCKYQRYEGSDKQKTCRENVIEEIADVLNMVEQLEYYFGADEIAKVRKFKIERGVKRDFPN